MTTNKRLQYFDLAKGIGILLVIIGHLQGNDIFSLSPYILPFCTWIFSFHMPLFFLISGMLMKYRNDQEISLSNLIKKRFISIMIPYFCFSMIYLSVVFYALLIQKSIMPETLYVNLWYVFSTYGMSVLWFLPTLFFAEIIFLFLLKKLNRKVLAITIVTITATISVVNYLISQLTFSSPIMERIHELSIAVMRPFLALIFIYIGYLVFSYFKESEKVIGKEIIIGIVLLIIGIVFFRVNGGVDFRSLVQKNLFFYYLCSVSTSLGLILICKNCHVTLKLLTFCGKNSLIIMAVHNNSTILFYAMKFSMFVNQYLTHARGYICYFIIFAILLLYSILITLLINHFFPFIIGKKKKTAKVS
ncbi:MAG: acyltransferase family protein [Clostridia bacterium]|nr:acyltransferase family protein [Clostridia bacterium]